MSKEYQGRAHYNLVAWKESLNLVTSIYALTGSFPSEERYGLANQMRRAAVSVPSNIAEGAARSGRKEFSQFINIARGSLSELETQLIIATKLGYIQSDHQIFTDLDHISRLITGLHKHINRIQ